MLGLKTYSKSVKRVKVFGKSQLQRIKKYLKDNWKKIQMV
jgi:hypothetical protein